MPIDPDLLLAKQSLSARLLRAGAQGGVTARAFTRSTTEAISAASHNVHAVGVGRKLVANATTETFAVRLYVVQKLPPSLLPPRDHLPLQIDGIPTDIIESPPAFFTSRRSPASRQPSAKTDRVGGNSTRKPTSTPGRKRGATIATRGEVPLGAAALGCTTGRQTRQRPLMPGISAALYNVTAGTIACFCRSTRHGDNPAQICVLSNNHVFANVNQAQPGNDLYQPSPADGAMIADHFAEFHRFVPLHLGGTAPNRVDAAIGLLLPGTPFVPEICSIGRLAGTLRAVEGLRVRKHGRTTGYTEGTVTDESVDSLVGIDHNNPQVMALFQNQIRIDGMSPSQPVGLGGDSGSLVIHHSQRQAVGLYFAGPSSGEYGLANHIADVLSEMQITLV